MKLVGLDANHKGQPRADGLDLRREDPCCHAVRLPLPTIIFTNILNLGVILMGASPECVLYNFAYLVDQWYYKFHSFPFCQHCPIEDTYIRLNVIF